MHGSITTSIAHILGGHGMKSTAHIVWCNNNACFCCPYLVEAADSEHILVVKGGLVVDPLPHLGAPNLCSGSILHQVVQGYTPHAPQPGFQVLHPHADIVTQAGICSLALGHLQQSRKVLRIELQHWLTQQLQVGDNSTVTSSTEGNGKRKKTNVPSNWNRYSTGVSKCCTKWSRSTVCIVSVTRTVAYLQKVLPSDMNVLPLLVDLVGLRHVLVEDLQGQSDQGRVRHPGAIMPVLHLPQLVCLHLQHAQQQPVGNKACTDTGIWHSKIAAIHSTEQGGIANYSVREVPPLCIISWQGSACSSGLSLTAQSRVSSCWVGTVKCTQPNAERHFAQIAEGAVVTSSNFTSTMTVSAYAPSQWQHCWPQGCS
jgi:hypothetical protein